MAMVFKSRQHKSGRGRRRAKHGIMSEINVTPMVDVMLVLLIIFMVAAPMLVTGVPIDLPQTQAAALTSETKPLSVSLNAQGQYAIMEEFHPLDEVVARLQAIGRASQSDESQGFNQRVIIRIDGAVDYQKALDLVAMVKQAGFDKIGLALYFQGADIDHGGFCLWCAANGCHDTHYPL